MVANLYKCKIVANYECLECISTTRITYFLHRHIHIIISFPIEFDALHGSVCILCSYK